MKEQRARSISIAIAMCALLFLLPIAANAQQNVSILAGAVKDAAGIPVYNTKVVVTNTANNQSIRHKRMQQAAI